MSGDEIILNPDEISKSRWERLVDSDFFPEPIQVVIIILAGFSIGTLLVLAGVGMIPTVQASLGATLVVGLAFGSFLAVEILEQ